MAQFVQRSSKLSPDEAALLEEGFPDIVAAHRELVASLLRKHGVLKSRLLAAKRAFFAAAESFLPPSQRGPCEQHQRLALLRRRRARAHADAFRDLPSSTPEE